MTQMRKLRGGKSLKTARWNLAVVLNCAGEMINSLCTMEMISECIERKEIPRKDAWSVKITRISLENVSTVVRSSVNLVSMIAAIDVHSVRRKTPLLPKRRKT